VRSLKRCMQTMGSGAVSARCEMERSDDESGLRAGTTPPSAAARLPARWSFPPFICREGSSKDRKLDHHWISNGSEMDRGARTVHEVLLHAT